MDENQLKMNDDKTEYINFVSNKMAEKIQTQSISINGTNINKREGIGYLGAWLDEHLTLREHIKRKCRIVMVNLQHIHLIRQYLTQDTTQTLVLGIVMSQLDYSNTIFSGLPDKDMANLQRIQNAGAKLVLQKDKLASSTECLCTLHWFPRERIDHKILTLVFKSLNNQAPAYLQDLLCECPKKKRSLQSNSIYRRLIVPFTKCKTLAVCSFSVRGPTLWSQLPNNIKMSRTLDDFKGHIKTFLFKCAFED